jgi:hypothetical protein
MHGKHQVPKIYYIKNKKTKCFCRAGTGDGDDVG